MKSLRPISLLISIALALASASVWSAERPARKPTANAKVQPGAVKKPSILVSHADADDGRHAQPKGPATITSPRDVASGQLTGKTQGN